MIKKALLIFSLLGGVTLADELAGRVNDIDRKSNTILVHPYRRQVVEGKVKTSPVQPPDVLFHVQPDTVYVWSRKIEGDPQADLNQVKKGSWVRVTHTDKKASKVVIHREAIHRGDR